MNPLSHFQPDDSIKKQSWVYSACLELIDRCDQELGSNLPPGYAGVQAESLDMARKQLDQIGMACNHLPCIYPFSASLPDEGPAGSVVQSEVAASQSSSHAVSPALQAAISDIEEMDHLYRRLVDRTSAAYLACGRKRTATRLKASLAALDLCVRTLLHIYSDRYPFVGIVVEIKRLSKLSQVWLLRTAIQIGL